MEVETRDSGVGSPSPHPAARSWGRKRSRRSEIKRLKEIQAALEDLASIHGGEVHFTYTPRTHPNLPKLYPHQVKDVKKSHKSKFLTFNNYKKKQVILHELLS